jgi:alkylation response protein AidB-like acyl-CoA dehydrogenase
MTDTRPPDTGSPGFLGRAEFELPSELAELEAAADRLGREQLAGRVREHEAEGRWPASVLDVLDGLPLTGLDLADRLGGVGAGTLATAVLMEAVAAHDAGGLPAADRLGGAAAALERCPERDLAVEVAARCLTGECRLWLTARDETAGGRVAWMPSWPRPGWVFATDGDVLRLHEVVGEPEASPALAFQASGGVSVDLTIAPERGRWELAPGAGAEIRARARLAGAAVGVGVAAAALEDTIGYTTDRVVFGKPVAHHQGNAFDLAHAAARIHGARLMVRHAATQVDEGHPDGSFWANQAWIEAMEAAFVATDTGIQLLGGHGFLVDHLAEKRFREARHLAMLVGGRDGAESDVAGAVLGAGDLVASGPDGASR